MLLKKTDKQKIIEIKGYKMKNIKFLIVLIILSTIINAQVSIIKTVRYGGANSDISLNAIKLSDNNYIIVGSTFSGDNTNSDILLIKVNNNGDIVWNKSFGSLAFDYCNAIAEDESGNLYLTGNSNLKGSKDIFLIKTDKDGNLLWEKYYEEEGIQSATGICITQNAIYLNGYTNNLTGGDYDLYVTNTDKEGNIIWQKKIGGTGSELASNIITKDDYIVCAGSTGSFNAVNRDMLAIKMDFQGNIVWQKNLNRNNFDSAGKIIATLDGGFTFIGNSDRHGSDFMDISIFKLTDAGVKKWGVYKEAYNYYDYGADITEIDKNMFIAIGNCKIDNYNNDILITEVDSLGNTQWNHIIDFGKNEWATNILKITSDRFMLIGFTNSEDGNYDIFNTIFEINTSSAEGESFVPKTFLYNNYPNPFNPSTTISYSLAEASDVKLQIFDITGQVIKELVNGYQNSGSYSVMWEGKADNGNTACSGVYFCLLSVGKKNFINKLTLLK